MCAAAEITSIDGRGPPPPYHLEWYSMKPYLDSQYFTAHASAFTGGTYQPLWKTLQEQQQQQPWALSDGTMSVPFQRQPDPPGHLRSMYANIPLPEDKTEEDVDNAPMPSTLPSGSGVDKILPIPDNGLYMHRAIEVHPILQKALSCTQNSPLEDEADVYSQPATIPSMGYLTLVVDYTGQTVGVHPFSPVNPFIVTIGDVIRTLKALGLHEEQNPKKSKIRSSKHTGTRISRLVEALNVWWKTEVIGGRQKSWKFVIGKHRQD
ncbi:hypothetical protein H0H92_004280 [Tricholoma furcatifolium]|nr:hypothetical protein H0H92_004280 [Tricholoma furcatifolium]